MSDFKTIKERARKVFDRTYHCIPGDQMILVFHDADGKRHELVQHVIDRPRTFSEGVILDGEFEGRAALAGVFVE